MAITRYKLLYQGDNLIRIIEIADEFGVIRENPISYTSSYPAWGALLSGINGCSLDSSGSTTSNEVVESCLYDDTTGDSLNLVPFVRYSVLDTTNGGLTFLGDYRFVATGIIPYTVVGTPILGAGSDVVGSAAKRQVLTGSQTWSVADYPKTYSVRVYAASGTPTITDASGVTQMFAGEIVDYQASDAGAGLIIGDLSVDADSSAAVVSWMELTF